MATDTESWPLWKRLDRRIWFGIMMIIITLPMIFVVKLPVPISPQAKDFKRAVDAAPAGSGVLIGLQMESISTAVELRDMWVAMFTYLIQRNLKIVFTGFGPAGSTAAENIMKIIDPDTKYNYKYGTDYVILPYLPGDEIAIAATATSFATAYATDNRGNALSSLPLMQKLHGLADMSISIIYYHIITYAEMFVRQWPVKYGIPLLVIGDFTSIAIYYPKYVQGNLSSTQQYAEWEIQVNIPGIELQKLDAMNMQALFELVLIFSGLVVSAIAATKPKQVVQA